MFSFAESFAEPSNGMLLSTFTQTPVRGQHYNTQTLNIGGDLHGSLLQSG